MGPRLGLRLQHVLIPLRRSLTQVEKGVCAKEFASLKACFSKAVSGGTDDAC